MTTTSTARSNAAQASEFTKGGLSFAMPYIPESPKDDGLGAIVRLIEEPYHNYWFHLGRFIHAFAQAESELLLLLTEISGLSKNKAGALFSGERSEGMRDKINHLLEATKNKERKVRLSNPFAQMATIGTIRNNIVHWGGTPENLLIVSDKFTVTNLNRRPLNPKSYLVSISDFEAMCSDLSLIITLLSFERTPNDGTFFEQIARLPWRYKPPQPSPPEKRKSQRRPKSSPQRGASQK